MEEHSSILPRCPAPCTPAAPGSATCVHPLLPTGSGQLRSFLVCRPRATQDTSSGFPEGLPLAYAQSSPKMTHLALPCALSQHLEVGLQLCLGTARLESSRAVA